ncbi:unnamed protein product [Rotaria socialis]|uniref:Uncharacterized protein n=1 Tax=Rotaria socialis TaxID=392032 RepID=A0A818V1X3_9BILA|nr:unnamed protein product [Rotaria socialis]
MSNPAQVLSRHRKTPLPPVVPPRQTLLSWTNSNQNDRRRCPIDLDRAGGWWPKEKNDDDNNDHYSSPPVKRIKLGK